MIIPEVKEEILHAIARDINNTWLVVELKKLQKKQPILAKLIASLEPLTGIPGVSATLIVYKAIEAQLEVNDLEDLYNGDS